MRAPEFWRHADGPAAALAPAAALYDAIGRLGRATARPYRASVPVICIGNLVVGGAGKTPLTLALARHLSAEGRAVHVVSRGYGGRLHGPIRVDATHHSFRDVGDEPLLLTVAAPTWVTRDRAAGARAAIAAGADILLLDDGFQNRGLAQDLALIAVDGGYGFGNGRVMPAGPLREDLRRGLARAQAAVIIGEDRVGAEALMAPHLPILRAHLHPRSVEPWPEAGVIAFAGIGRPRKFFDSLAETGADIAQAVAFPDHHPYRVDEVEALLRQAEATDMALVTTTKDRVRLPPELASRVRVLTVDLVWEDEEDADRLDTLLDVLKR